MMKTKFAALLELIQEPLRSGGGGKTDHSILLVYPPEKELDFREYLLDTFTQVSETLRAGGTPRDVMGIWVSGFFGSGKSHFAKVLGYLLQNDELEDGSGERCIDVFFKHLSDTPRGKEIRLRLGEIKLNTQIKTLAFEIKSRQSLTNPNSIGEILLSELYRGLGWSENFDEMGTFIGDSNDRISELNAIAEMIGNKGKGRVWLIVTSQQDLERVVDRTNFQPALE